MCIRDSKITRKPRASEDLTSFQRAYLLTGVGFDFLRGDGDKVKPFRSMAASGRAWASHRNSLMIETGDDCRPWGYWKFDTSAKEPDSDVSAHEWHSEYGRPASEHSWFKKAKKAAVKQRWNPSWIRTWTDVEAVKDGCYFDTSKANHAVAFFRLLRHTKGDFAGKPFVLMPWQKYDVVMPLFGWCQSSGIRRYSNGYIEIPKKNGKSTLCSGISLYMLIGDGEAGAEVYNVAADRRQATIVFRESMRMAKACPYINNLLRYRDSIKRIDMDETNGEYEALSSDVATKEGMNISGIIFDELHAQKNRDLFDTLLYGGAARVQPLFLSITTAGRYDPLSIGWEQHEYARRVLEGGAGPGLSLIHI
jgi:hypothetical protein